MSVSVWLNAGVTWFIDTVVFVICVDSECDRSNAAGDVDPSVSKCMFAQMYKALLPLDNANYRMKLDESRGILFGIKYDGEEGLDYGGLYRCVGVCVVTDVSIV